ncbi:hypothetical protein ILUMI_12561 [Ignelater luminosus]|uniref:Ubiquitin-like protease family profile domain-containing protein n=1 Tax=Ignelater luminosus TaxID=2038154 RepID=A0A8K0CYC1_IGNLU|nr:hypothetical protein ILUMI_12561 [Ignelater luminosus]
MSRNYTNPVVLSFHESLLRVSDIELLRGPCWLNDTVISFYFEYLEKKRFKNNPFLLFVPPQVTQCIKITPSSEISVFLSPLIAQPRRFIFFALNDNEQTEVSGGSHWSLLVFSYPEKMIFHFDSSKGTNQDQAVDFGEKLLRYFGLPTYGCFSEPMCLQQTNGYDCGIHVLCNAENIADHASRYRRIEGCPVVDRESVLTKRSEILDLISSLRQ